MPKVRVVPVPCLQDNYAYLVHAEGSRDALVVDPSEREPVTTALAREQLELAGVLATHHHYDHIGGIEELARDHAALPVVCSQYDFDKNRVPKATRAVHHDESFELAGLSIRVLEVPGHTLGAVAYVIEDTVFTGDTMFIAGCGRLFEGTPAQMYVSLKERIGALPPATRVYCGHEYTRSNARFAAVVEPENKAAQALLDKATKLAEKGEPTVPSTIAEELAYNPFLRTNEPSIAARYPANDAIGVLAAVRAAKDAFR